MRMSFVIPCYYSGMTIENVILEIQKMMQTRSDYDFEIIAVNDCSPDNVLTVLKQIAENDNRIKIIDLAKKRRKTRSYDGGIFCCKRRYNY